MTIILANIAFGCIGLLCVCSMVHEIHKRLDGIMAALNGLSLDSAFKAPMDDVAPASTDYVQCGGCGKTVPLRDGFNPEEHDCTGLDDSLIAK